MLAGAPNAAFQAVRDYEENMNLLERFAALWRPRTVGRLPASHLDPEFLGAVRKESDIIASSFEEDSPFAAVVEQIERSQPAEAIRTIRESFNCSHSDARILAEEVRRAVERVQNQRSLAADKRR
jgi:hypothetical protein